MMSFLYIAGLVVVLLALYLMCTLGIGCFIVCTQDPDYPEGGVIIGYMFGCMVFVFLAIATLKAYHMVPGSGETLAVVTAVEETEEIGD